jgi:hypothetical protein
MLKEWLASRSPTPPGRLAARLSAAIPAGPESNSPEAPGVLITAALAVLRQTITEPSDERNRAAALDLLAADALITYAVEAAAEDCESFATRTGEMISQLCAVAGESPKSKSDLAHTEEPSV